MSWSNRSTPNIRRYRTVSLAVGALVVALAGTSCESGPQPPQPGTPAFHWAAAKETYRNGDYLKTSENLQRILASESEFATQARAWDAVLSAGLAAGYTEFAETWALGERANRANPTPFHKEAYALRKLASASAIQYAEDIHKLMESDKGPTIRLAFPFPAGAAAAPVGLKRIGSGILVPDSERDLLQTAMLRRGVLLSACASVGNPDDPAAGQDKMKAGDYQVPREVFLLGAAKVLSEQSDLFTGTKLDQPNLLKMMSLEARQVLASLPPGKDTKAIGDKVEARLKKANLKLD